jgi:3-oxoacyl-(acyl-carrier-protein) synthase
VIAAAEVLRRQTVFAIGNTRETDPTLSCRYLLPGGRGVEAGGALRRVLVASAGFGGMHGAIVVEAPCGNM